MRDLIVSCDFWLHVYFYETGEAAPIDEREQKYAIAELLYRDEIRIYKLKMSSTTSFPPCSRTFTDAGKNRHLFAPTSAMLTNRPEEVQIFHSVDRFQRIPMIKPCSNWLV